MAQQILINIKLPGEILKKSQIKILYFTNKCSEFVFKYIAGAVGTIRKPRDSNGSAGAFSEMQSAQGVFGESGSNLTLTLPGRQLIFHSFRPFWYLCHPANLTNSFKSSTLKLHKTAHTDSKLTTVIVVFFIYKVIGRAKSVVSMPRNHMARVSHDFY